MTAISKNLKRMRVARKLSQKEVADRVGLSRVAYGSIESGKSEPRVSNLQKLAGIFDVKLQDIVASVPRIASLRFRALDTLKKYELNQREEIVSDVAVWLKDFNELEDVVGDKPEYLFSGFSVDNEDTLAIVAGKARNVLGLDEKAPIFDICEILEKAGIKIYLVDSDLKSFFGLSVSECDGGPAICVNISKKVSTIERQIFTVCHEFGHLLLHKDSYKVDEVEENKQQEKEANEFASHFLMPQKIFEEKIEENRGMHWVDNVLHAKRFFRVSYQVVLKRLEQFADNQIWIKFHTAYQFKYKERLIKHKEPRPLEYMGKEPKALDVIDFVEDRLSRLVMIALEKELISFSRGAEILRINLDDMREKVNSWGMLKWKGNSL